MKLEPNSVKEYIAKLPNERKLVIEKIQQIIQQNIPKGFTETISYGMIGYVVPHKIFPSGYHCNPKLPLPFINLASQKNFVALYHMGLYADEKMYNWFISEYPKHAKYKLDIGKSCIRFKKMDDIPYQLIGELVSKMTVDEWINIYQKNYNKK